MGRVMLKNEVFTKRRALGNAPLVPPSSPVSVDGSRACVPVGNFTSFPLELPTHAYVLSLRGGSVATIWCHKRKHP